MISRRYLTRGGNLELRTAPVPEASVQLERNGFAMLPDVLSDDEIYERRGPVAPIGRAGDVVFFVSDVWHRRMPTGQETLAASSCKRSTADATSPNACAPPMTCTT